MGELLDAVCRDKRTLEMARYLLNGSYIRVVNYHVTRPGDLPRFRREVAAFAQHFTPVTMADLDRFFATRVWPYDKPGLIPAVFEGWRTHYDVYAKVLDEYGFTGWFYVPAFFPDVPVEEQIAFCKPHGLRLHGHWEDYSDPRCCMTWEELCRISEKHVICCHTGSHSCITENQEEAVQRREIVDSKRRLEEQLGVEVPVFCWRAGDEYAHSRFAHKMLAEAGYRYLVSNLKLEKIR